MCLKKQWRDQPGPTRSLACLLQPPLHEPFWAGAFWCLRRSCRDAVLRPLQVRWGSTDCAGGDGAGGACARRPLPGASWALAGPGRQDEVVAGGRCGRPLGATVKRGRCDSRRGTEGARARGRWEGGAWRGGRRRPQPQALSAGGRSEAPGTSQAGALLRPGPARPAVPLTGFAFEAPTPHSQIFVALLRCAADLFLLIF